MRPALEIAFAPERLDAGEPEERACFGLFTIRANAAELTGGIDFFISAYRAGPLVSAYHAAEWLAWNWWRLCYEPKTDAPDWWRSHRMTAIGEGYAWPNITIFSDGVRTTILSEPSARPDAKPFRYVGASPAVMPSQDFQTAVDRFISQVQARLREQGVGETGLDRIWRDVMYERRSADLARRRHLEALLGRDADAADDQLVDRLIADEAEVGAAAVEELAAHGGQGATPPTSADLWQSAQTEGYESRPGDAVRLIGAAAAAPDATPAWQLGAKAARALRMQESLGTNPISDDVPASLAGVAAATLRGSKAGLNLSFAIDRSGHVGKIVFRSKWKTGRRFALARLLADRIFVPAADRLRVATRACTYRQQVQRSFAAEFLSPFEAVEAMLDGDYSAEAQSDAAAHFVTNSSTLTRSASAACRIFDSRAGGREAYNFLSRGRIARVKIISVRIDRWALSSSVLPGGGSRGKGLILNPSPLFGLHVFPADAANQRGLRLRPSVRAQSGQVYFALIAAFCLADALDFAQAGRSQICVFRKAL